LLERKYRYVCYFVLQIQTNSIYVASLESAPNLPSQIKK